MPPPELTLAPTFAPVLMRLEQAAKTARESNDVVTLVRCMDELRGWVDGIKKHSALFTKMYDRIRFTQLPDSMTDAEIANISVEGIGRVSLTDDMAVTVADKVALLAWLEENGLEDLVTESVNAQTLTAFVKRRIREAAATKKPPELPMEILTIRPFTRATITAK